MACIIVPVGDQKSRPLTICRKESRQHLCDFLRSDGQPVSQCQIGVAMGRANAMLGPVGAMG